ncbi:MAG: methionyl-tRNA formyltransferase, partial [Candidatus Nanopelagicales bacterium]
ERLRLGPVQPVPDGLGLAPGLLRAGRSEVLVGTATLPVRLGSVQPAGRRAMPAADWARGARPGDGARFA